MESRPRLIIVGGFLGAGKTTLLFEATRRWMAQGLRVGLITNDQASELVDTAWLLRTQAQVDELSGSCFCCNFNGFIESVKRVGMASRADIIMAEPVGSCTDLSATIIQPLKALYGHQLQIAPLTVLADPNRLARILEGSSAGLHPSAAYILRKQMEESDMLLIAKADLIDPNALQALVGKAKQEYPKVEVYPVSAKTGQGVDEWMRLARSGTQTGRRIVEVDYDTYAEGEAVLGWLNAELSLHGEQVDWDAMLSALLREIGQAADTLGAGVGHIKVILESGPSYAIGNVTGTADTLSLRGTAGVSDQARIIINARVGVTPDALEGLVTEAMERAIRPRASAQVIGWSCLSPGYPRPTHRFNRVVHNP